MLIKYKKTNLKLINHINDLDNSQKDDNELESNTER